MFFQLKNIEPTENAAVRIPVEMENRLKSLKESVARATNFSRVANDVLTDTDEVAKTHFLNVLAKQKKDILAMFEMNDQYILILSGYVVSFQEEISLAVFIKKSQEIYKNLQKELGI